MKTIQKKQNSNLFPDMDEVARRLGFSLSDQSPVMCGPNCGQDYDRVSVDVQPRGEQFNYVGNGIPDLA